MKILKRVAGLLGMALGAGAIYLAVMFHRVFSSSTLFHWSSWGDYVFIGVLATLGVALIFVAYDFGFRQHDT